MTSTPPPTDDFRIRCPKLGHQIYFSYCVQENMGLPCIKTLDCWYLYFDVEKFLGQELSEEDWNRIFVHPVKPKMVSIIEMLQTIQKKNSVADD